tara:strand:- start:2 stop:307 length:306 start_codon:yes stop_codon:yes gene_type:complete
MTGHDNLVIRITQDGDVCLLYDDALGLHDLGKLEIRRASHVEHDDERQEWVATLVDGEEVGWSSIRAKCLNAEVRYLNARISAGDVEEVFANQRLRITKET